MVEKKTDNKGSSDSVAPFETVTLAEIFIQQGHLGKGLAIYRKLLRLKPGNLEYQNKIIELTSRIEAEGSGAEGTKNVSGQKAPAVQEGANLEDRVVHEGRDRVLETLNQWLIAVRKRKKHVQ